MRHTYTHSLERMGINGFSDIRTFGGRDVLVSTIPEVGRQGWIRDDNNRWRPFDCVLPEGVDRPAIMATERFRDPDNPDFDGYGGAFLRNVGILLDSAALPHGVGEVQTPRQLNSWVGTEVAHTANALYDQRDSIAASMGKPTADQQWSRMLYERRLAAEAAEHELSISQMTRLPVSHQEKRASTVRERGGK